MTNESFPKWNTEMMKLSSSVCAYVQAKGSWGLSNAGLIIDEKYVILVDTLNSLSTAQAFKNEIYRITNKPVKYIIITHNHPDHIWGNQLFPEAVSICQTECYDEIKALSQVHQDKPLPRFSNKDDIKKVFGKLPDITYGNEITLHLDNQKVHLQYYGFAHSRGDTVVFLPEENIVFCGDLLFYYSTPVGVGGLFSGWIKALNKLAELKAKIYVPGHGPPCDLAGLFKCRDYLTYVFDESKKAFDAGLSYREAALKIHLGEYRHWADTERVLGNVRCIYREFMGQGPASAVEAPEYISEMMDLAKSGWQAS
jgi:cyclase